MDPGDCCIIGKDKCSCVFPLALSKPLQSSQPGTGGCHLSRLQPRSPSYIPLHKKAPATSQGDTSNPRRVEAGLPKPHTPHAFRKPTNTKENKTSWSSSTTFCPSVPLPSLFKRPLARADGICFQFHPFSSEKLAYIVLSEKTEDE